MTYFKEYFRRVIFLSLLLAIISGFSFVLAQLPSPSKWEHVATYDKGFFNPGEFRVRNIEAERKVLLVLDHSASDQMLAHLRLENGAVVSQSVRSGHGPGEVSGNGMEISQFSDGGVLLWDGGHRRANVYDENLRFEGQVRGLRNLSVDPVALVNDSTLATVQASSTTELFRLYRLRRDTEKIRVDEEPLLTIHTTDHKRLDRGQLAENFMIRQGIARRIGDELYFGFMFGSLVAGMSENGLTWTSTQPVHHSLPVYDFRDGNAFVAPALERFPRGILDVTGDDTKVYVLYSGQKFADDRGLFERITGAEVADAIAATEHSNRLFVFDRTTGTFVKEVRLPIRATGIEITSRYAVLLTTEDREAPTFEVYRLRDSDDTP